jgi:PKD repeat protein
VQFTDLSIGDILTRVWEFGDVGTVTSSLLAPTHTYNALGYYTVSLTVQDAYTSSVLVRPRHIHVTDEIYNAYLPVILKDYVP